MSTVTEIEKAAADLPQDELEQLIEDLLDLAEARAAIARIQSGEEQTVSLDELDLRLKQ